MIITPQWPAPGNIVAFTTTRQGGVSIAPYDSFNLATHVGDDAAAVLQNRHQLRQQFQLPQEPAWLNQIHSNQVVSIDHPDYAVNADASVSHHPNRVCTVLTADCLPILLCDRLGTTVAAIHAGWRGLATGIIENTVAALKVPPASLLAWLGPAISQAVYEIGEEVYQAFPRAPEAFIATQPGHWRFDLYAAARQQLHAQGVTAIYGGDYCTYRQADLFYSYRREGVCGRMASLIYIKQ